MENANANLPNANVGQSVNSFVILYIVCWGGIVYTTVSLPIQRNTTVKVNVCYPEILISQIEHPREANRHSSKEVHETYMYIVH